MAHRIRELAAQPDNQSCVPATHMVEENSLKVFSGPIYMSWYT